MRKTRWGIIGPGAIAHNFADGLKEAPSGELVAIASRDQARRGRFGDAYTIAADRRYADYTALAAETDVDAVYISTPHPFHAELAIMAMRAGKSVLCEKPAGMTAAQVVAMTDVAAQEDVFFMEAFMYRCHPQIARMLEILASGEIGDILHIRAAFGYAAPFDPESRAYSKALGGGGILDVGCYPVSLARLVAGAATGRPFDNPDTVAAVGTIGRSGIDEATSALLQFASGVTAECAAAVARTLDNSATITGSRGSLHLPDPWVPGRNAGPSDATISVTVDGQTRIEEIKRAEHLFAFEAEAASRAILEGPERAGPAGPWPCRQHWQCGDAGPMASRDRLCGHRGIADSQHGVARRAADRPPAGSKTACHGGRCPRVAPNSGMRQQGHHRRRRHRLGRLDGGRRQCVRHWFRLWQRPA